MRYVLSHQRVSCQGVNLLVVGLCLDPTGSVEWTVHAQSKSGRSPVREVVLRDVWR